MDIVRKLNDLESLVDVQWDETVRFANDVTRTLGLLKEKVVALEAAQQVVKQVSRKPSKLRLAAAFGLGIYAGVKIIENTKPSNPTPKNEV